MDQGYPIRGSWRDAVVGAESHPGPATPANLCQGDLAMPRKIGGCVFQSWDDLRFISIVAPERGAVEVSK